LWDNKNHYHLSSNSELANMSTLANLKPGQSGIIQAIHSEQALYYRLAAMGFRIGKKIEVVRSARFAGPLHVRVGSTDIMLRRNEAQHIELAA
jgi:ferrous iron transport protein A